MPARSLLSSANEFEGFDPVVWVFRERVTAFPDEMWLDRILDERIPGIVFGCSESLGAGRRRFDFQLFASWVPGFGDGDDRFLARVRRWLDQGEEVHLPDREAYQALRDDLRRDADPVERVLKLALRTCRESVILVGPAPPSVVSLRRFARAGKALRYVDTGNFSEEDLERLRRPTFAER